MPTEVLVALISAIAVVVASAIPAILIQRARQENDQDHANVRKILTRVEHKIDTHLEDHGSGFTRRNRTKTK